MLRGRAREGVSPLLGGGGEEGVGASPEKFLKFMTPIDGF